MNFKENRKASFIIIALIYVLATAVEIVLLSLLSLEPFLTVLIADVVATLIVFIFSLILKNASVYDPYWSVQPLVLIVYYTITEGFRPYTIILGIVITLWSLRLTANWAYTFKGLTFQDWRYTMLEEKTKKAYPLINFLGIHLVPTLVVYACMLPTIYSYVYHHIINAGAVICLLISVVGILLELFADIQMHAFKKRKAQGKTRQTFIRDGLWKHCRHPNYLGEILMWWGIGLSFVFLMPDMWYLILGAILNTLLFVFISIPMAENRLAQRSGYLKYKEQTRYLIPIKVFKK